MPTPLRSLREAQGLTQAQVAALIGVTQLTYSNWERKINRPLRVYLEPLAQVLNVSVEELDLAPTQFDQMVARRAKESTNV